MQGRADADELCTALCFGKWHDALIYDGLMQQSQVLMIGMPKA